MLGVGSTLYIPVFNEGALFFTGDPHGVQGDGEVDGGALEQSLTGTLQFILHKGAGKAMRWPRAEDATNYYTLGLDVDLNIAMKEAVREAVELLQAKAGVTAAEAYAIASMGVDFRVAEAVDFDAADLWRGAEEVFQAEPRVLGGQVTELGVADLVHHWISPCLLFLLPRLPWPLWQRDHHLITTDAQLHPKSPAVLFK